MNYFVEQSLRFAITEEGMTPEVREYYNLPPEEEEE